MAMLRGRCGVVLPREEVHDLEQGDVCLIGRTPYVVASDPKTPAMEGLPLFTNPDRDVVRLGGDESVLIGGSVSLSEAGTAFALDALPPFLHIGSSSPSATAMARTLGLLEVQTEMTAMGGTLVAVKLAEVLLVEALRVYSADKGRTFVGWISALGDRQIGDALRLMHGEIAFAWTVSALAKRVGMSRSAFSDRFAGLVGRPPHGPPAGTAHGARAADAAGWGRGRRLGGRTRRVFLSERIRASIQTYVRPLAEGDSGRHQSLPRTTDRSITWRPQI